ncbi:MAG: metallophosphoesterase [Aestuariivirgaceae bacterium]
MLTLAHLSDVHLAPLPRLAMKELRGKRLFGYQSWRFRRRHIHEQAIANLIAADVKAFNPDHIALTGDLINLSAKLEFGVGAQWLAALARPDQLTFVPGNHDAYVPMSWDKGLGLWSDYMTGDLRMAGAHGTGGLANPFPFVRQRRNIALIGVSTALPQPIGYATGRMGNPQIEKLAEILGALRERGFYRILLIHHPPLPGLTKPRKELLDAAALQTVLETEGAELVLHGHNHTDSLVSIDSRHGPVHVVGTASASANGASRHPPASWYFYQIKRQDGVWRCEARVRRYDPASRVLMDETQFSLDGR